MELPGGLHLAYCTNIHRGETWTETFDNLERYTLRVRERVGRGAPYAIGLRLSELAARELSQADALRTFRRWLDKHDCYVFTINGFPYGRFHGTRVKEQVYAPDWTTVERVTYTNRLFDLLAELVPPGVDGSVSTVPCSFKSFIQSDDQVRAMRARLWETIEHVATLSERSGRQLHLGLEPEPLCYLETSEETTRWFHQMRDDRPGDPRLDQHLGVNYDACHLAVEFEEPHAAIAHFEQHGVRLSKIHFSSALKVQPTSEARNALASFTDDVYLHQVVARTADGSLRRHLDLDLALAAAARASVPDEEWRVHFHIPLHCQPGTLFHSTVDHLLGLLDLLAARPQLCSHAEMETYTWEVLPHHLKQRDVVEQLVAEYEWTLARWNERVGVRQPG
jgi:sugar phosphate isomerase/epimerase